MKLNIFSATLLASAVLATGASAAGTRTGQWSLGGVQQLCLVADSTWYYTTFAGGAGKWANVGVGDDKTIIFGNYASGAGNDSMILERGKVDWTEWRDDLSYTNFLDDQSFTFVKKKCDAKPVSGGNKSNPMD